MGSELLHQLVAFDRRQLRWLTAVRCTIGLGACLVVYRLAGHPSWGILASLGSIYAAFASYAGIYQSRLRHMRATAVIVSIQAAVGTAVGASDWAAIACVTIVSVLFSLYAALRPAAGLLATYAMACTVIFAKVLPVHEAVGRAAVGNGLIVLSGALSQIVAMTLMWPFTRFHPERRAVAFVYEHLSAYALAISKGGPIEMLNSRSIQDAHETLDPLARYYMRPEQVVLRRALSAAEGIRAALVAVSSLPETERAPLAPAFIDLADRFADIARSISAGKILTPNSRPAAIDHAGNPMLAVIESLLARLSEPADKKAPSEAQTDWKSHLSFRVIALESSRSLRWMALQHAFRVGAAMLFATCLARFGGFPNGYWIALTTAIVLRTDYATTLSRGFARAVGAVLGVLIAMAVAGVAHRASGAYDVIFILSGFGFFAVYPASYTAYSTLITIWVLASLAAAGVPERVAGWYRLEDTVLGAAIAFLAYRLLPTWQTGRVREVLLDAASAQLRFCERVLLLPDLPPRHDWERELEATRAIRYEAESVVAAASKEPSNRRHQPKIDVERSLIELERNAAGILGVLAHRLAAMSLAQDVASQVAAVQENARRLIKMLSPRAGG